MFSSDDRNRLRYHSRRGMLELDMLLLPFFDACFDSLPYPEQQHYARLLECEDTDLLSWLLSQSRSPEPDLQRMVGRILEYRHSQRCS